MNELTTVQEKAAAILQLDAYFTDPDAAKSITVLTQKKGDLETEIKQKLEAIGISVVLITPLLRLPDPSVDDLTFDSPLIVQVTEEPINNTTGKGALDVVCEIIALLHGAPNGVGNSRTSVFRVTETPLTLVDESPTYHVNFTSPVSLIPRRAQPAPPTP